MPGCIAFVETAELIPRPSEMVSAPSPVHHVAHRESPEPSAFRRRLDRKVGHRGKLPFRLGHGPIPDHTRILVGFACRCAPLFSSLAEKLGPPLPDALLSDTKSPVGIRHVSRLGSTRSLFSAIFRHLGLNLVSGRRDPDKTLCPERVDARSLC